MKHCGFRARLRTAQRRSHLTTPNGLPGKAHPVKSSTAPRNRHNRRQPTRQPPKAAPSGSWTQPQRRLVTMAAVVALALVLGGAAAIFAIRGSTDVSSANLPRVGGDLHTLTAVGNTLFVGGHDGVGRSRANGRAWSQLETLNGADAMGWAQVDQTVWVGGHPGLFKSTDSGSTFAKVEGSADIPDAHALGGVDGVLYAASPRLGVLASTDNGRSWSQRTRNAGQSFMGTMLVDPTDTDRVIAPDMAGPLVESRDGGRTWAPLGGPTGSMAATWNPKDRRQIVSVGMSDAAISDDSGRTWKPVQLPDLATAVTFTPDGKTLLAAALDGDRAVVSQSKDHGRTWTPVA